MQRADLDCSIDNDLCMDHEGLLIQHGKHRQSCRSTRFLLVSLSSKDSFEMLYRMTVYHRLKTKTFDCPFANSSHNVVMSATFYQID